MGEPLKAPDGSLYRDLSAFVDREMEELQNLGPANLQPQAEAEELLELPDCVQIFFVSPEGRVSTFSEPLTLRIFRLKGGLPEEDQGSSGGTFIQVGGWTHPLIPGQSPVLEAGNGAFMFPDVYGNDESAAVGLVIADGTPFNLEGEAEAALAQSLQELTAFKDQRPAAVDPAAAGTAADADPHLGKVGKYLLDKALMVNKGIQVGAAKAVELIEDVSEKQKAKLGEPRQGKDAKVNPALKIAAKGAFVTTKATVKVSGFVANRVGKLTKKVADDLAKMAAKPVVSATGGPAAKNSSTVHSLVDAARGGLMAYGTVYSGLEDAAKAIGTSVKSNSVHIVKHQYGEEAGMTYDKTLTAAGNAAMTYMNVQSLGVKGMIKSTAKQTGKSLGKAVLDAHMDDTKKNLENKPKET